MQHLKLSLQLATFLEREKCCFSSAPSPPWALALDNKKLTLDIKHEFGFLFSLAVSQFGSGSLVGPSAAGLRWGEPEPWLLWSQGPIQGAGCTLTGGKPGPLRPPHPAPPQILLVAGRRQLSGGISIKGPDLRRAHPPGVHQHGNVSVDPAVFMTLESGYVESLAPAPATALHADHGHLPPRVILESAGDRGRGLMGLGAPPSCTLVGHCLAATSSHTLHSAWQRLGRGADLS